MATTSLSSVIIRIEDGVAQNTTIVAGTVSEIELDTALASKINMTMNNIAVNAFRIAINGSLVRFQLQDGVIDDFQDGSGVIIGNVAGGLATGEGIDCTLGETFSASEGIAASAFDDDIGISTVWDTPATAWLQVEFAVAAAVSGYSITAFTTETTAPKTWTLSGSDTGVFGGEETLLDTRTDIVFTSAEKKHFAFSNTTAYKYYRFASTVNNGHSQTWIPEFELFNDSLITSDSETAESQPVNIHTVVLADDAAIILNTDLKFYVSVDDGSTWEQLTLEDSGDFAATQKILTGSVAITGTGTTIKYKIKCVNADYEFYAVGLLWD